MSLDISSGVEFITPQIAQKILDRNDRNRSVRDTGVAMYAEDMRRGRWRLTGEAIKIAASGRLIDGRHRLLAVVESGVTVAFLVVRGLDEEVMDVLDSGMRRTAADAMNLRGEVNATTLASVAKMVLTEGESLRRPASHSELITLVEADPTIRAAVAECPYHGIKHLVSPTVSCYSYWRMMGVDHADAARFFGQLSDLIDLPAGSPILALHKRLSAHHRVVGTPRYRREALFYVFSAWNAWRAGESRTIVKLAYRADGSIAIPDLR